MSHYSHTVGFERVTLSLIVTVVVKNKTLTYTSKFKLILISFFLIF